MAKNRYRTDPRRAHLARASPARGCASFHVTRRASPTICGVAGRIVGRRLVDGSDGGAPMDDQPASHTGVTRRVMTIEAQVAALRRTYCRELVREGRLDWDGLDFRAGDDYPNDAGLPPAPDPARPRPWRPWRRPR